MSNASGFFGFLRVIGRGLNLTRIVILNLIFFGVLALIFGAGSAAQRQVQHVEAGSVLVIEPRGELVEQSSIDPLTRALLEMSDQGSGQVQLRDLVRGIDAAAGDKRIASLLLLPDALQAGGFASLHELGQALERFRASGKKVRVWSAGMDQMQYYLAVHADEIMLDPQGGVMLTGLGGYRNYFKGLLDKLGVTVHLFRVGQYKSAGEPFVLDHASPEAKRADAYWMGSLWDTLLAEVAAARGLDEARLRAAIDALPAEVLAARGSLADLALSQGLVDELLTRPQMRARLREAEQAQGEDSFRQVDLKTWLATAAARPSKRGRQVAIVVAEGEIAAGSQAPGTIGGDTTSEQIRKVRNDDAVAAVVLRVNSPGGAVYPSEQIRREVELTRAAGKPVVVSMGDVAASGGYWISMDADRIYADPNTITGSIGIFGMFPEIPETLDKVGITTDGVGTTEWAGAFDLRRSLDPRVGEVIQAIIDKGYRDFVGQVADARGRAFGEIDAVAQGRVWSGEQALERGLVDELGGVREAAAHAAALAELGDAWHSAYVERPLGRFEALMAGFSQGRTGALLRVLGVQVPAAWLRLDARAPELRLLTDLKPGKPAVLAHCLCRIGN